MALLDFLKITVKTTVEKTTSFTTINQQDRVIPIEERIAGKQPTCDSLYPHEILVLSYADKYNVSKNVFPGFWWYRYGIKDVQKVLLKLEVEGFIEAGSSADALTNQKLSELK